MPPGRCAKIRLVALLSNTVVFELITLLLTIQTNHHCVQFIKTIFLLWRKANFCNGWAYSWRTGESANNCWVRDRDGETDSERERLRFWKFASYYTARSRSIFLDKAASFGRCLFDYRGKHSLQDLWQFRDVASAPTLLIKVCDLNFSSAGTLREILAAFFDSGSS